MHKNRSRDYRTKQKRKGGKVMSYLEERETIRCEQCGEIIESGENCYCVPEGYIHAICYDDYIAEKFNEKEARDYIEKYLSQEAKQEVVEPLSEWNREEVKAFIEDIDWVNDFYDIEPATA